MKPKTKIVKGIYLAIALCSILGAVTPAARAQDNADGTPWYSTAFGGVTLAVNCTYGPNELEQCNQQGANDELMFRMPVQLPDNTVLPPGTYRFALAADDNPNIVQVFDAKDHVVTSMMTVPAYRDKETEQVQITLAQSTNHQPAALLKWFAPGEFIGHELIYDRNQERKFSEGPANVVAQPTRS